MSHRFKKLREAGVEAVESVKKELKKLNENGEQEREQSKGKEALQRAKSIH